MSEFRFENPLALLLLVVPLAIGLWSHWRRQRTAAVYSSVRLVDSLPPTARLRLNRFLPGLRVLGLLLLVVALARPQMGLSQYRLRSDGIAIAICLDRSGSMQALDFSEGDQPVNRLQAVKRVIRDFVLGKGTLAGRPDDQISLIAFGGYAEDKTPLTLDHESLIEQLDAVEIPQPVLDSQGQMVNERLLQEEMATAIGDAVALAVDRLKQVKAKSKVIILLSDGENTAGVVTPEEAARTAGQFGIKIYSVGVGSTGLAPFPTIDRFGRQAITRQRVRLDEATLKMLADSTGGRYFNARDAQALESVYAVIDKLEKTVTEGRVFTQYNELYLRLLWPGLALVLLDVLLRATWLRTLP